MCAGIAFLDHDVCATTYCALLTNVASFFVRPISH